MVFDAALNWIFGPITNNLSPRWSVIVISFFLTLLTTLAYKFLTDQKLLKSIREEMKQLQAEAKKARENPQQMMQINQEIMKKNAMVMKSGLKPMLITFAPLIIIFGWLSKTFTSAGDLISIFGWELGWLGTYILSSIVFSIALRKIMKVY